MSRRSDRLRAQADLEAEWRRQQQDRPAIDVERRAQPTCPGRFDRTCNYYKSNDGLWRCCWCAQLSPRSRARLAEQQKGGG